MSFRLEWVGLAGFRLIPDEGPVIVMDPYDPTIVSEASETDRALLDYKLQGDVLIASSLTDEAHSWLEAVEGEPEVINALDIAQGKIQPELFGERVIAVQAAESPFHPEGPDDNAMYAYKIDNLWLMHMGDLGYEVGPDELAPFAGRCDILLALTGEYLTMTLDALDRMIDILQPTWIVPMHYRLPPLGPAAMIKLEPFLKRHPRDPVIHVRHHTVRFPLPKLAPDRPTIVVLEPSAYEPTELN